MRSSLIIAGIILIVLGVIFTVYTFGFGIICSWPLMLLGVILIILGAVLSEEGKKSFIGEGMAQQIRRCPVCGRQIPLDANICPYCARKFS
ncbi:MAG: hypothetical protein V1726_04000 [Methanobacteriota archaeon]